MRKTKTQKGITLVALIITIIVLLILAVVAIGAVRNDGIIDHAKNARRDYSAAQTNESTLLGNYLDKINANAPQTENGGETPEGTGGAGGAGTGGNQGTTITFTINGTEYTAESGMTLKQWANSNYDIGDKFLFFEGFVVSRETFNSVCSDKALNEKAPANVPIVAGSAYYYNTTVVEQEETITFYYNGKERTANKGDTWLTWSEYSMAGCRQVDGYLIMCENLVCYDDGTWVKADEEIRERTLLYKAV